MSSAVLSAAAITSSTIHSIASTDITTMSGTGRDSYVITVTICNYVPTDGQDVHHMVQVHVASCIDHAEEEALLDTAVCTGASDQSR